MLWLLCDDFDEYFVDPDTSSYDDFSILIWWGWPYWVLTFGTLTWVYNMYSVDDIMSTLWQVNHWLGIYFEQIQALVNSQGYVYFPALIIWKVFLHLKDKFKWSTIIMILSEFYESVLFLCIGWGRWESGWEPHDQSPIEDIYQQPFVE